MSDQRPGSAEQVKRNARFAFVLLFLLYMFDYIDRLVIVSLFPSLKAEWGLTDAQCGLFVSAVYWSILFFSLPASIIVDRWSRKMSIGIMSILWSFATLSCAFTKNFRQLFAARTAIGIGEAGYAPGGTAMISGLFPEEKRARLLGIWNAAIPLGSAIGIALGGIIAEHLGWRHAFGIVAVPGLIVAILFFRVRDYRTVDLVKTKRSEQEAVKSKMSRREIIGEFAAKPSLLFNNLAFAANVFVTTSLMSWLPTYFHRTEGLPMDKAGTKAGLVMLLAVVGAPLGGYLTDRWLRTRRNARMLLPALSSLVSAVLLMIAFFWLEGGAQYLMLLAVGTTIIMFVPAGVAVTQDVVHPGLRATSLSLNIIIQHALGSTLGPLFVGYMSDRSDLLTALTFLPIFAVLAALLFFIGSLFYVGDVDKVERIEVVVDMPGTG